MYILKASYRGCNMAMKVRWNVKQLRLKMAAELGRDVDLTEVAEKTGIDVGALSRIENNRHRGVRFETLEKLAEFYQVESIAPLLTLSEDKRRMTARVAQR